MGVQRDDWPAVADAAAARVASWMATLAVEPGELEGPDALATVGARADLIEGSRRDDDGFAFTRRLLEAVVGASDPFAAALGLREASKDLPASMPAVERLAVRAGGFASLGLPWAVLPVARKWLRDRVSHLVLSAKIPSAASSEHDAGTPDAKVAVLRAALAAAGAGGGAPRALFALGGAPVLGDAGASAELRRLRTLAELPEVNALALDVARLVPAGGAGAWSLDRDASTGAVRLRELFECAQRHGTTIVLESSDYRSALLAPQLLVTALEQPGLERLRAGITLPAELPESLQTAEALVMLSRARLARGAEPLEIGVGTAGFSGREQISSILTGLPVPTLESRGEQAAQLFRVLVPLLEAGPEVRAGVASDDPHLLAAATVLAERAGGASRLELQLRAGVASELEAVIADHGFEVRRRLPIVPSKEFSGAVEYLIALAAETADPESVLAHARSLLSGEPGELELGADRLRDVFALAASDAPESRRVQHRGIEWSEEARDTSAFYRAPTEANRIDTGGLTAAVLGLTRAHTGAITLEIAGAPRRVPVISDTGFANEPDTDASRYDNRAWARGLLNRGARSDIGVEAARLAEVRAEHHEELLDESLRAAEAWRETRASERGTVVGRLALGIAAARDRLIEVSCAESGAPLPVIDAEVNSAIDAARYLGALAGGLGAVRGAEFRPDRLALVVADAGTPLAERAEAVLAAVAAGSSVVLVAHPSIARSSGVLLEEWEAAGLPSGLVVLVIAAGDDPRDAHVSLATRIAADARIDRALVLGNRSTASFLTRRRPDLRIEGRFRQPGVVAITPSADPANAVRAVVASAFGAEHRHADTARAVVLLGAAARSGQLRRGLVDAVASLRVGDTARPGDEDPLAFEIGPLPESPNEAGLRALTRLEPGEEWLVQPQRLDDEGRLWRPGVRAGVSRDSSFWKDAIGVPVIGLVAAHSVDDMISLCNRLGGGGVAGLHANDPQETLPWLERVRAARLVVDRPTTGARIERQPGGGWGSAGMGASALAGGPHRLQPLGSWQLREGTASQTLHLRGLAPEIRVLVEKSQPYLDYQSFDRVRRAVLSDALAWRTSLGRVDDVSGLGVERNLLRHWPVATHVRLAEGSPLGDLVRVVAAGLVAGAPMTVSTGVVLPPEVSEFLALEGVPVSLERDDDWLERLAVSGPGDGESAASRVRLIGGDRIRTAEWLGGLGDVSIWAEPVTMAGPVELLAFVREQAVSITAHRHGLALVPAGVGGWLAELQGR